MSEDERRALEEDPELLAQVSTSVVWPNGVRLDAAMLALIYQGFGARKGWPHIPPDRSADARFPVPPLHVEGARSADWMQPMSTSLRRLAALKAMVAGVAARADTLKRWEEEAHGRLVDELPSSERRDLLGSGRAVAKLLELQLDRLMDQLAQTIALDAIADGGPELIALVDEARRWNFLWAGAQEAEAAEIFDPLANPDGFREELRARLAAASGRP